MNSRPILSRAILVLALCLMLGVGIVAKHATAADPIRRARVFDTAVTGAAPIVTGSITTKSTLTSGAYRITVALSGTNSVFNLQVIGASTEPGGARTVTTAFNGGTALTAGQIYTFTVGADRQWTYNFTCTTTTRVAYLLVDEAVDDGL